MWGGVGCGRGRDRSRLWRVGGWVGGVGWRGVGWGRMGLGKVG